MMRFGKFVKGLSIRQGVIFVSIIVVTIAILTIGSVVFVNWISSTRKMAERFAVHANKDAIEAIDTFLDEPLHINIVTGRIIEEGMVDFSDAAQRDRFLTGVLLTHIADITSYTVGLETGEFYGARRNADGEVEILANNQDTGWRNVYYSMATDGTASQEILNAGPFDPRTRDWYIAAKATGKQVLTKVELPLAYPIILAGLKIALIINISAATLGASVGAGGLGVTIISGIRTYDAMKVVKGTLPVLLMALLADNLLRARNTDI